MTTPQEPDRDARPTGDEPTDRSAADRSAERAHDDWLVDEWGEETFPASDPPADY